jgi:hypothetical protein
MRTADFRQWNISAMKVAMGLEVMNCPI